MKNLKAGEKVMAKWPGSALWFPAVVLSVGDDDSYEVRFEDGTEDDLPENYVLRESSFRRSRSRSPARKQSPSRRRSRSPARKKSPARKASASPSRKPSRSPARKPQTKLVPPRTQTKTTTPPRTQIKTTPTRTQIRTATVREEKKAQTGTRRSVTRTESHIYSTRSATRSGVQTLESPVDIKMGKVPRTSHYEFGGPIGIFIWILFQLFYVLYPYFACNKEKCELASPAVISLDWHDYYDCTAYEIFFGFLLFQAILALLPVGRLMRGQPLRTGLRLQYRLNGFLAVVVSIVLFISMIYYKCGVTVLYDKFMPLAACSILFSILLSVVLYIMARRAPGYAIAAGGNSGNIIYDFFMGHELNPRPFQKFDLKLYILRTALIGWALLDIAFLVKAWGNFPENPPYPLICVVFFQVFSVLDLLFFEETLLTMVWVQRQGVGFLMVFSYLCFIPFTYTIQARYLVDHPPTTMPHYCLIPAILLNVAGYIIYRHSNLMKSRFTRNPRARDVAELESIPTSTGKRLLVAGLWGIVRKPNYLGDFLMVLSWSLYCGFDSIFPYFYPIVCMLFLVFRERQDSIYCKNKYGSAWDQYCKRVPYRFIPRIY